MKVFEIAAGIEREAAIQRVTGSDYLVIKRSKQFVFNWHLFKDEVIYKLICKGNPEILGLIYLVNHDEGWNATEIKLLEVGRENVGRHKKRAHIAGCLIARACMESIKSGYGGWVFLKPKTELAVWYHDKYGFEFTGYNMASDDRNSRELIKKYL